MSTEWPPRVPFPRLKSAAKEPRQLAFSIDIENHAPAELNELKPGSLLLGTAQLQVGMRVNVVLNHSEIALDPKGYPLILQVLETGVPPHAELFPVVTGASIGDPKTKTRILPIPFRRPAEGLDISFSPTEVFNQHILPNHGTFVSFCNGKLVTYDNSSLDSNPEEYEPNEASPVIKVTHKNGRRFLNLSPVKRMLFSRASYADELLFVRLYQGNELEELIPKEQVDALSQAITQREHAPKSISLAENRRRMDEARNIFGEDFFGPEEIAETFGIKLSPEQIPPLDIDPAQLKLARPRRLPDQMMLVLGVDKASDGTPLTIEKMEQILQPRFLKRILRRITRQNNDRVLAKDSYYHGQSFFTKDTPRFGWFLVAKNTFGTDQTTYLEQTQKIGNRFDGTEEFTAKKSLLEQIKYLRLQTHDLQEMAKTDPDQAAAELSHLALNRIFRQTPVETIYTLMLYFHKTGKRLLENETALTSGGISARMIGQDLNRRFRKFIIGVGPFDKNGIKISEHSVNDVDPHTGNQVIFRV